MKGTPMQEKRSEERDQQSEGRQGYKKNAREKRKRSE